MNKSLAQLFTLISDLDRRDQEAEALQKLEKLLDKGEVKLDRLGDKVRVTHSPDGCFWKCLCEGATISDALKEVHI